MKLFFHQSLLLFIGVLFSVLAIGQNAPAHPYFRNYTTEDGLPSPEVHYALQDDEGYMWFATDNGISRFDGYEFKNYGPEQGLKHPVVFFLQKDSEGKIWMGTMSGHLYYVAGDTILPFDQNEIIENTVKEGLIDFYLNAETDTKYIAAKSNGILVFDRNGNFIHHNAKSQLGAKIALRSGKRWVTSSNSPTKGYEQESLKKYDLIKIDFPLEIIEKENKAVKGDILRASFSGNFWGITFQYYGDYFFGNGYFYLLKNDSVFLKNYLSPNIQRKTVFQKENGEILGGFQKKEGLKIYENIEKLLSQEGDLLLQNISVSHIFKDRENGYWITTVENGIFYCPDINQRIFDISSGLSTDHIAAISFKNPNELFIGLRNGDIFRLDSKKESLVKLPLVPYSTTPIFKPTSIIYDLVYDKKREELWVGTSRHAYWNDVKWSQILNHSLDVNSPWIIGKNLSLREGGDVLWGSNSTYFGGVNIEKKEAYFVSRDIGLKLRSFFVFEDAQGRIWVGTGDGVKAFKNNQLIAPEPYFEPFGLRAEDMDELSDSTLVIGTKGGGILLWKGDSLTQITKKDGLTSDMIENVHVDPSGTIWVGTLEGLNQLTPTNSGYQIRNYFTWHGLPSNEITQVRSFQNQVWVATTKGLMQWKEPIRSENIAQPILEKIMVNNQPYALENADEFGHDENNLEFRFLTLNYRVPGKIPYRFRLNEEDWTETLNRSVNYSNLAAGDYRFEVQSKTEDGVWSASTRHEFSVLPPWWETWWFRFLSFGMVVGFVVLYYKNRTEQLKKEANLQKEINDLEKAALQAQMNPHFIFNCLNSIQNFIIKNDRTQAVNYLSKFAKLTRRVLKSSADGKIILDEEIDFLKNYLSLEQLRFKEKFDFNFEIDEKLNLIETEIPPLLIQPFVENAVKHGMKDKTTDGKIEVIFEDAADSVNVKIRDNGTGIFQTENKTKLHRSMGMNITTRRLKILGTDIPSDFRELKNESGEIIGSEVSIFIRKL